MAKAKKGTGKLEYIALQKKIKELLYQGYSAKSALEELQAKKT